MKATRDEVRYYGLSVPSIPALRFLAHKKTSGQPYKLNLGPHHFRVLSYLLQHGPSIDSEMSLGLRIAQLAARRCELRDIGCVMQDGTRVVEDTEGRPRKVKVWTVTDRGREVFELAESGQGYEDPALDGFEEPRRPPCATCEALAETIELLDPVNPVLLAYREVTS